MCCFIWPSRSPCGGHQLKSDALLRDMLRQIYVMHADGQVQLKCTPECEARVFRDTYEISMEAFKSLKRLACPVTVAAGTEKLTAPIEAEAPFAAAQVPRGRFEK